MTQMRYLSVCSGIEAATVAWHSLGWKPVGFAEIAAFPSAVLAHHYPNVPNFGDFTKIEASDVGPIDLLVGGTPCQDFSVAGKRLGLDGARGNLALEFCRVARRLRPRWIVWENVPGVHSNWSGAPKGDDLEEWRHEWRGDEHSDFGAFLDALEECGYSSCWRVLDSQYVRVDTHPRAVPQRRKRVFVVGYLGDWRPPAAVLFEPEGLRRDTPPRRASGKNVAPSLAARTRGGGGLGTDFDCDGGLIARCVTARQTRLDWESETFVAHSLRADGFDASEDGTGRGTPIIPITSRGDGPNGCGIGHDGDPMFTLQTGTQHAMAFDTTQITSKENRCKPAAGGPCHPLPAHGHAPALAFHARQDPDSGPVTHPLDTDGFSIGIQTGWAVRRLSPTECERLQAFPDGYTAIPYRGKIAADGPRYKALGNSMSTNVMRWIGLRIALFEETIGRAILEGDQQSLTTSQGLWQP